MVCRPDGPTEFHQAGRTEFRAGPIACQVSPTVCRDLQTLRQVNSKGLLQTALIQEIVGIKRAEFLVHQHNRPSRLSLHNQRNRLNLCSRFNQPRRRGEVAELERIPFKGEAGSNGDEQK